MSKKDLLENLQEGWQEDYNTLIKEIENITAQFRCVDEISTNLQEHVSAVIFEIKREAVVENKISSALKGLTQVQQYVKSETMKRASIVNFKKGQLAELNSNIQKVVAHKQREVEEKKKQERILKKVNSGVDLSKRSIGERPEKLKDIRNVQSESLLNVNKTIEDS